MKTLYLPVARTPATVKMCISNKFLPENFNTQQLLINFLVVRLQKKHYYCYCSLMEKTYILEKLD